MLSKLLHDPKSPTYPELRAAGKSMFEKVIACAKPSSGFEFPQAARALGLPTPGNVLVFDGEEDIAALSDFFLAEFRVHGRTLVETCDPAAAALNARESEHLDAFCRSRTSLFETCRVRPAEDQVVLRDLLEPEQPEIFLTDIHLCESLQRMGGQMLLFLRLLEVHEIIMSSGLFFVFDPAHRERLLQSFRHKMKKVAPADRKERKFAFFYQKHREFGEEQAYADVPLA